MQLGVPMTLITDNMAGHFMSRGKVDLVVVGADRIAANGDVANKIGTYSLAVIARENGIPFYVAAPTSTVDLTLPSGAEIPIEERSSSEVVEISGQAHRARRRTRRPPGLRRDAQSPGDRDHHRARRAARAVRVGAGRSGPQRDAGDVRPDAAASFCSPRTAPTSASLAAPASTA